MESLGITGEFERELRLALAMADDADAMSMSRYRASDLVVTTKPDATPVTEADQAVERMLRATLGVQMRADAILGEEFGDAAAGAASTAGAGAVGAGAGAASTAGAGAVGARRWIIDPIDGTKNYMRGVPVWCTLIGLAVDGVPVVGVVSAPALGRRWWAARGAGAWTRDVDGSERRIHVSGVRSLADASFSFSDAVAWDRHSRTPGALQRIIDATWRQRAYGDFLSHMLVAEGAVDIAGEPELAAWDMAALIPVIVEAGGRATGYAGGDPLAQTSLLTTNGLLHQLALDLIAG